MNFQFLCHSATISIPHGVVYIVRFSFILAATIFVVVVWAYTFNRLVAFSIVIIALNTHEFHLAFIISIFISSREFLMFFFFLWIEWTILDLFTSRLSLNTSKLQSLDDPHNSQCKSFFFSSPNQNNIFDSKYKHYDSRVTCIIRKCLI